MRVRTAVALLSSTERAKELVLPFRFALLVLSALILNGCARSEHPVERNLSGRWTAIDGSATLVLNQSLKDTSVVGYGLIKMNGPTTQVVDSLLLRGTYQNEKLNLTFLAQVGNLWPIGFVIGKYSQKRERIDCTFKNMVHNIKWHTDLRFQKN